VNDWDEALAELEPELAARLRAGAARAGLQAHDPAARLLAEMWVAVATLRGERTRLSAGLERLQGELAEQRSLLHWVLAVVVAQALAFLGWLVVNP
jgi:hypothetical protein